MSNQTKSKLCFSLCIISGTEFPLVTCFYNQLQFSIRNNIVKIVLLSEALYVTHFLICAPGFGITKIITKLWNNEIILV